MFQLRMTDKLLGENCISVESKQKHLSTPPFVGYSRVVDIPISKLSLPIMKRFIYLHLYINH